LACDEPPKCERASAGSRVDGFEPAIRALLTEFPDMPATVIAERIGWEYSSSVLRARIALLRPLYRPADPADRTTYVAGEIVQCDLWFPGKVVPVAPKVLADPPVLTMVAPYSGFIMAVLLPSRTTRDLVAGMWRLLTGLGGVPKLAIKPSGVLLCDELVVGDVGADFAAGAVDPLLDLGQELINQHRPGHPAIGDTEVSGGNVPGEGVMRDPGELAGITQRPGQIKRI
jgi:hypothetical protein